ncbi:MAG: hypothetical protein NZO16_06665 [Deltaproteobacteria bacterium]|nr:hypothetical protein [Deltaproteobacteria bacterium]
MLFKKETKSLNRGSCEALSIDAVGRYISVLFLAVVMVAPCVIPFIGGKKLNASENQPKTNRIDNFAVELAKLSDRELTSFIVFSQRKLQALNSRSLNPRMNQRSVDNIIPSEDHMRLINLYLEGRIDLPSNLDARTQLMNQILLDLEEKDFPVTELQKYFDQWKRNSAISSNQMNRQPQ